MEYPKISCVMVVTEKPDNVRRSIDCYLRQTYPNKELIIFSQHDDSDYDQLKNIFGALDHVYFYTAHNDLCLGEMRNIAIELSHGEIICQWDNCDLFHPLRLICQFNSLNGDGVIATIYHQYLNWFQDTDEIYWIDSSKKSNDRQCPYGSMMFRKDVFFACNSLLYPNKMQIEDQTIVQRMLSFGKISGINDGNQYIHLYQGDSVRGYQELSFRNRILPKNELLLRRPLLELSLSKCGIDRTVKICANDGPVFEYRPEV